MISFHSGEACRRRVRWVSRHGVGVILCARYSHVQRTQSFLRLSAVIWCTDPPRLISPDMTPHFFSSPAFSLSVSKLSAFTLIIAFVMLFVFISCFHMHADLHVLHFSNFMLQPYTKVAIHEVELGSESWLHVKGRRQKNVHCISVASIILRWEKLPEGQLSLMQPPSPASPPIMTMSSSLWNFAKKVLQGLSNHEDSVWPHF